MLEALLLTTGKTVGCYTSPHLLRYNERVRVAGSEVSDSELIAAFADVEEHRSGLPLTYFEFGTLAALVLFASQSVDIAVLEVGLGGRLDAVNAVEPTACLITNIALDHCEWLGDNVELIGAEKAGIMRAGKPVVFAAEQMPQSIVATAKSKGARLIAAGRDYEWSLHGDGWSWQLAGLSLPSLQRPGMAGEFQLQNAAGVLALLAVAGFEDLLQAKRIDAALASVALPGRAQLVDDRFILDVAHNPAAAVALAKALAATGTGRVSATIIGMLDDKDVAGVSELLDPLTDHWIAVKADSPRAFAADELARQIANATDRPCWIADSMSAAIDRASEVSAASDVILITGSFYTVAAALVILAAAGDKHG
jgi:dihydrofolate synthase/folylpolyglutamate synthase